MAGSSDRIYFPSLEDCLKGERIILSWKLVASALADQSLSRLSSPSVLEFLKDSYVHQLLKSPSTVFSPPDAQSKSSFDTKTAAINVTPAPNDKYDLKAIKDDALWLSNAAKINEVAALRVVTVEFQSRALSHLTGTLSTQDVTNLQEACDVGDAQASAIFSPLGNSALVDSETIWAEFEKERTRRLRILALYLSERRFFMGSVDTLLTLLLYTPKAFSDAPLADLSGSILTGVFGAKPGASPRNIRPVSVIEPYLKNLPDCLSRSEKGPALEDAESSKEFFDLEWARTCLSEILHSLSIVFQLVDSGYGENFADTSIVEQWFQIVADLGFLDQLQDAPDALTELTRPIRSLVCVITLSLLRLGRSVAYLAQDVELDESESPYLGELNVLDIVHRTIFAAANADLQTAYPVIFAWTLILHRMWFAHEGRAERRDLLQNQRAQDGFELEHQRPTTGRRNSAGSIISIEKQPYDAFLVESQLENDMQVVEKLALGVTADGQVYELIAGMSSCMGRDANGAFHPTVGARMRYIFVDLLKASFAVVGYISESVSTLLSILEGGRTYWDISRGSQTEHDPAARALQDSTLLDCYVYPSLTRYPYEYLPFVRFGKVLSAGVTNDDRAEVLTKMFEAAPALTIVLPEGFQQYELIDEVDNTNLLKLLTDIPLFWPSSAWKRRMPVEEQLYIPSGTIGRFMTDDSRARIVMFDYEHSVLTLLGKRLEVNTIPDAYFSQLGFLEPDETAEGIALLATIIRAEVVKAGEALTAANNEAALNILKEASQALSRTKDIFSVVCDTLDNHIQDDLTDSEGSDIAIITACLQFLHAVLPVCPGRVWAYMARCALLNTESRAGRLSRITGNLDMVSERFECLSASVKFFSALITGAVDGAVQRRIGGRAGGRQDRAVENTWVGASDKVISRVCLSIAQAIVDVFENSATWRFPSEMQRSSLVHDVVSTMNVVVSSAFGIGEPGADSGLTAFLHGAAKYTLESFLLPSSASLRFQPLLLTLLVAFKLPESIIYSSQGQTIAKRAIAALELATNLLRAAKFLKQPTQLLEARLFKTVPLIARLLAVHDLFSISVLSLLGALLSSSSKAESDPPSLLGYLGPQASRTFVSVLTRLDRPFERRQHTISFWGFFSTVLRTRQQWIANCLLTGKTPREALRDAGKISSPNPDSVFSLAISRLRSISNIPSEEAMAILEFFAAAQNFWPWVVLSVPRENSFLTELRTYVRGLKPSSVTAKADATEGVYQTRIAGFIADIFAMQLYHLRQIGQAQEFAGELVSDIDYYLRDGIKTSIYNASLHSNLAKNFTTRYSGCVVDDFKLSSLTPRELGSKYYYALDIAEDMLKYDPSWHGPRRNGFRNEMETANLNLSLVDAQLALFNAWEYLLLELSVCMLPDPKVGKQMLQVAEDCLEANQNSQGLEVVSLAATQARADLALTLLQRLADNLLLPKDMSQLLIKITSLLNSVQNPFGPAQIQYYRTLLKVLYVILRGSYHSANSAGGESSNNTDASVAMTQMVLTILDHTVAQGFRTLVTMIHDNEPGLAPEDIALITAILQACLGVPGMDQCQTQILNIVAGYDVPHVATSLFSWGDKLTDKGDPVYGELSMLFLLELSALPVAAEQLACDGLLGHLTSAKLAGYMRRTIVSPFAENISAARCYSIWAKGLLPLLLNILGALGASIAPEVAYVLNQFPNLLQSSIDRFEAPGMSRTAAQSSQQYITLLAVSEIHSLALLTRVLRVLRTTNTDIVEVGWEAPALLENIEFWLSSRTALRERLLPLSSRETEWRNTKSKLSGYDSKLEEKVVLQLEAVRDVLNEDLD